MLLAAALNYDAATRGCDMRYAIRFCPSRIFYASSVSLNALYRSHGDGESILMFFISIACIVILAANFPTGINLLRNGINSMMDTHNDHVNNMFYQILNANLTTNPRCGMSAITSFTES